MNETDSNVSNSTNEISDLLTSTIRNHYKVLNVSDTASRSEIREAYLRLKSSMSHNDAAFYSLGEGDTSSEMLREIEEAFCVLENDESRRRYDRSQRPLEVGGRAISDKREPVPAKTATTGGKIFRGRLQISVDNDQRQEISNLMQTIEKEGLTGNHIEQIREAAKLTRAEVYKVTRITPEVLEFIESENFEKLPSKVYVRGFLVNYLKFLAFEDPVKSLQNYMQRFDEWSQN
ncbi:helix-turn-helix domain-containing protein [Oligoflexaceae bacterium]|nr:helix-turn-helix domain-containing protein [Oligoflexaceae bacterium]